MLTRILSLLFTLAFRRSLRSCTFRRESCAIAALGSREKRPFYPVWRIFMKIPEQVQRVRLTASLATPEETASNIVHGKAETFINDADLLDGYSRTVTSVVEKVSPA